MRRSLLIPCLLLVAGCGADAVTAGVEVVESRNDPVTRDGLSAFERVQASVGDVGSGSGSPDAELIEPAAPVDIVAGPSEPERPETVAVIGDSLALSAQEEIVLAMAPTEIELIVVDGVENRRMTSGSTGAPPGTKAIEAVLEDVEPDLWVIALGTNDVGAQTGTETFRDDMDGLLDLLPIDAAVIWVDLWIRDLDDSIIEANEAIRLELGRRRGVGAVVDWHTRAASPGVITGDGVHLTTNGQQLFAESIVNAITTMFGD